MPKIINTYLLNSAVLQNFVLKPVLMKTNLQFIQITMHPWVVGRACHGRFFARLGHQRYVLLIIIDCKS